MLRRGMALILSGLPRYLGAFLSLLGLVFLLLSGLVEGSHWYPLGLLTAGLCLLLFTGTGLYRDHTLVRDGTFVEGQVIRRSRSALRGVSGLTTLDGIHRAWILHYCYEVAGRTYTGRSRYVWKAMPTTEPDTLRIYYDSRRPHRSALDLPIF